MDEKIQISDLQKACSQILTAYADEITDEIRSSTDKVAKDTIAELKSTSPKRTGSYAKGWSKKVAEDSKFKYVVKIYNRTNWHLTHLLEYGHRNRVGKNSRAYPHIEPANAKATNKFLSNLEQFIRK